jgi:hypothetical protein
MKRVRRRHAAESVSDESRNRRPIQPGMAQPSPAVSSGESSSSYGPLELDKKLREESYHGIAKFPLTKTTGTAAYAAVAAKASCLLALVKGTKDPAKAMVRPLSIPSLVLGLLTQ